MIEQWREAMQKIIDKLRSDAEASGMSLDDLGVKRQKTRASTNVKFKKVEEGDLKRKKTARERRSKLKNIDTKFEEEKGENLNDIQDNIKLSMSQKISRKLKSPNSARRPKSYKSPKSNLFDEMFEKEKGGKHLL